MPMNIRARVTTGARKESVIEIDANNLRIAVKEKPQDNAANNRVIELVTTHYRCPTKNVRITRGHTTPSNHVEVHV